MCPLASEDQLLTPLLTHLEGGPAWMCSEEGEDEHLSHGASHHEV